MEIGILCAIYVRSGGRLAGLQMTWEAPRRGPHSWAWGGIDRPHNPTPALPPRRIPDAPLVTSQLIIRRFERRASFQILIYFYVFCGSIFLLNSLRFVI